MKGVAKLKSLFYGCGEREDNRASKKGIYNTKPNILAPNQFKKSFILRHHRRNKRARGIKKSQRSQNWSQKEQL